MHPIPGGQEGWIFGHHPQSEPAAMESLALAVEAVKHPQAPQPVLLGQGHKINAQGSDGQAGTPAATAGTDHPAAGVAAHAHTET